MTRLLDIPIFYCPWSLFCKNIFLIHLFLVRWSLSGLLFLPFSIYHVGIYLPFFQITVFTCNFMWFMKLRASAGMCGVCAGVRKCTYMYVGGWGVSGCVRGCLRVCVLDEFSEYLLETRGNTSADFNTYPIRIF